MVSNMITKIALFQASSHFFNKWLLLMFPLIFLIGCATQSQTSGSYSTDQARKVQTIQTGTVENVKAINISSDRSGLGLISGGVVGGIAGSSIGKGKGRDIAAVIGAVAGSIIGDEIEKKVNTLEGQELTVLLKDGNMIVVAQEISDMDGPIRVGDKVRVITGADGLTRVSVN